MVFSGILGFLQYVLKLTGSWFDRGTSDQHMSYGRYCCKNNCLEYSLDDNHTVIYLFNRFLNFRFLYAVFSLYCTLQWLLALQGEHVTSQQTLRFLRNKINWRLAFCGVYESTKLTFSQHSGAPKENIVQNHLNIALLNVF